MTDKTRPRVLIFSQEIPGYTPGFEYSGHSHYMLAFIDHFTRQGVDIIFVAVRPTSTFLIRSFRHFPYKLMSPFVQQFGDMHVVTSPSAISRWFAWKAFRSAPSLAKRAATALRSRLRRAQGFDHVLGRYLNNEEVRYCNGVVDEVKPDLILLDTVFSFFGRRSPAPHWILTHDVMHQRAASFAELGYKVFPADFDRQREAQILQDAGHAIAIQWTEAALLRALVPNCEIVTVPMPVDRGAFKPGAGKIPSHGIFVGSGTLHNVDGINWFINECWPLIRMKCPTAELEIVGTVAIRLTDVPAGIRIRGTLTDLELEESYGRASYSIVPLRMGSGLKVKLVESLARGIPTVTTSVGAQGLLEDLEDDLTSRPFLVADEPGQFSESVLKIIASPLIATDLERAAQRFASRFGSEAAFAEFRAACKFA